jgi:hypothetical protein
MSGQMTQQDQRTDRTNKIITAVVGCVLLGVAGFVALQNRDSFKLPDRNKMWADAWKKKIAKPMDLPEFQPVVDWSDPKNDPSKMGQRLMNMNMNPSFPQGTTNTSHRSFGRR